MVEQSTAGIAGSGGGLGCGSEGLWSRVARWTVLELESWIVEGDPAAGGGSQTVRSFVGGMTVGHGCCRDVHSVVRAVAEGGEHCSTL